MAAWHDSEEMRPWSLALSSAAVALVLTAAPVARADLGADAARVAAAWRAAGAEVTRLPTRFLWDEQALTVRLPETASPRKSPGPVARACTTVALVAARGTSFRAKLGGIDDPEGRDRSPSIAGVAELTRCDGDIDRIIVAGDAGRGAVEIVVAIGPKPAPPLREVLPERTGGVVVNTSEPGPLPSLPPAQKRIEAAEGRALSEGAALAPREQLTARADGTGLTEVDLEPGCHRIELLASELAAGSRARFDVDAELRDTDDDALLARDRSEAADARLYTCVGGAVVGAVAFAGAPPQGTVTRVLASWPIPDAVPRTWGSPVRAKMAQALLARGVARLPAAPIYLTQGGVGLTSVSVDVEGGACYVATVAGIRGRFRQLTLRASVGAIESSDERGAVDEAGAVAFCTHDRHAVKLDVEARGTVPWWALALYRLSSGAWETKR